MLTSTDHILLKQPFFPPRSVADLQLTLKVLKEVRSVRPHDLVGLCGNIHLVIAKLRKASDHPLRQIRQQDIVLTVCHQLMKALTGAEDSYYVPHPTIESPIQAYLQCIVKKESFWDGEYGANRRYFLELLIETLEIYLGERTNYYIPVKWVERKETS